LTFPIVETLGVVAIMTGAAGGAIMRVRRAAFLKERAEAASRTFVATFPKPARPDAWRRIASLVPGTADDLAVLGRHWNAIDEGLDVGGLTPEEEALRRVLRHDLPRIADALEETLAVAVSDDERRRAGAHAIDSVQSLLAILNAHRRAVFDGAHDSQKTVGRYLDAKREGVDPTGPLAIDRR
jgi:hypothetical protein